jgi:C1A family cysteine protease
MQYCPKLNGWQPDCSDSSGSHTEADDYKFVDNLQKFSTIAVEKNGVLDLRQWCSPIENQGELGSCVGNGVVGALEFLQIRNGQSLVDLSRLFVYYNSRLMHQAQDKDEGTYIHLAMGTLSAIGTCTELKWPYDISKAFVKPTWGSYREAYVNKIDSYYRISGSGDVRDEFIKRALQSNHVVVFGMTVDQAYIDYEGGIVAMPKSVRVNSGGHCQVIVGYDDTKRCWIVRNSWGTSWGEFGYAYVPYTYLDASEANDFWVPYLPGTPAPDDILKG